MKIKSGFLLKKIAGSWVVVPVGSRSAEFHGMLTLNDTGAFIWGKLSEDRDEAALVQAILDNYDGVDEATAQRSVAAFVEKLSEINCLE